MYPMTNLIRLDNPRALQPDDMVLIQMADGSARQAVVRRDDDLLTPSQIKENWTEVRKAMLSELQTWGKLKCFSRKPRKDARNIIDVRWVIKY